MERKIILLVEDNADDEELTMRALKKNTFIDEVVVARDGTEALDHLFGAEDLPDLVLLDLKLPKVDGIEVLRNLRAHERGKLLPVVVLTSSDAEVDRLASYGHGANSYIRKPVDFMEFTAVIRQVALYWLILNRPVPRVVGARPRRIAS